MLMVIKLLLAIVLAYLLGKLVSKFKLPAILGWLLAGMILGPHAVSLINQDLLAASWYQTIVHILECAVGLMIGTELVWNKIKQYGKSIMITTLTQSLGTFLIVSCVFGLVFYFMNIPLYLAFIFGGIALATAPAPALSIVREFKTEGPVTQTLIPMAALDDIIGCIIFFTTIAIVAGNLSGDSMPSYMIPLIVLLPLVIGALCGVMAGLFLRKETSNKNTMITLCISIVLTSVVGFYFNNQVLPSPVLNFMLIGMAFSAAFSNMISEQRLEQIMGVFNPVLGISMIVVILNLGAPLDYHLILGAGLFTVIYIVARAFGKYFGAYFGASITHSSETVKKYLGLTLLPHSGVSLVFTGIAVSILTGPAPDCAQTLQGTIAAAAVINEIIAVILAKKGFEWANELNQEGTMVKDISQLAPVITISRQYGSGGRDIALALSQQLNIPFYDKQIVTLASDMSSLDQSVFEQYEMNQTNPVLIDLAQSVSKNSTLDDRVFEYNSQIIKNIAHQGPCIIVGRCADYVLRKRPNVIKVYIYGDLEKRKERVVQVYKENINQPNNIMEKVDKKRISYYHHYTNQIFGDSQNYDLCLNSSTLGIDECVNIIAKIYQEKINQTN